MPGLAAGNATMSPVMGARTGAVAAPSRGHTSRVLEREAELEIRSRPWCGMEVTPLARQDL